jgi:hypothetical protein
MKPKRMPRRDWCLLVGNRGQHLNERQAAEAWYRLCRYLWDMGERDVPKYNDLITAIRKSIIFAHENRKLATQKR